MYLKNVHDNDNYHVLIRALNSLPSPIKTPCTHTTRPLYYSAVVLANACSSVLITFPNLLNLVFPSSPSLTSITSINCPIGTRS